MGSRLLYECEDRMSCKHIQLPGVLHMISYLFAAFDRHTTLNCVPAVASARTGGGSTAPCCSGADGFMPPLTAGGQSDNKTTIKYKILDIFNVTLSAVNLAAFYL